MNIGLLKAIVFILVSAVKPVLSTYCGIQATAEDKYDLHPGNCIELVCRPTMGKTADSLLLTHSGVQIASALNVTSLRFQLTNITFNDSGRYECRGIVGNVRFKYSIDINVFAAPKITSNVYTPSCEISPRSHYRLRCSASGYPVPDIQWLINGKTVTTDLKSYGYTIQQQQGNERVLNIFSSNILSITLSCVATNRLGQDRTDMHVTSSTEYPDVVLQLSKSVYIAAIHQTITMECRAFLVDQNECQGFDIEQRQLEKYMIEWNRGGKKLNSYKAEKLSNRNLTTTLEIANVSSDSVGDYWCEINYRYMTRRKSKAVVIVPQQGLPSITLTKHHQSTSAGAAVTLTCFVKYSKLDKVVQQSWAKNGSTITSTKSKYTMSTNTYNETGNMLQITSTLRIHPFTAHDQGRYTCTANTVANQTSQSIFVNGGDFKTLLKASKSNNVSSWEVIGIVITACLLLSFVTTMLLRYLKRKNRFRRSKPGNKNFVYESFLTYSDKDLSWIKTKLIPLLEKHSMKYCMPCRDYEIGKALIENITDSIHQSRTVIAVLSKNFMSSKKCKDELDVALYRVAQNYDNSLVAIRIDAVEKDALPKALRNKTFLDYNDMEERKYWEKRLLKHLFREESSNDPVIA